VTVAAEPADLWRTFAPRIAGRPMVKLGERGSNAYHGSTRALFDAQTGQLRPAPDRPAAVLLYDKKRRTRCLVGDFDVKKFGKALAVAEAHLFARWIEDAGGRVIVDRSHSGGRHVYVLLATPRHFDQVLPLMEGLRRHFSTLDIGPMRNYISGCIRPPGAAHRDGGRQMLVTPLAEALAALEAPNGDHVWRALIKHAGPVSTARRGRTTAYEDYVGAPRWRGRKQPLTAEHAWTARTGAFDRAVHPGWTRSEARQSVVRGAYKAGWLLPEVIAQVEPGGGWEGLRRLLAPRWRTPKRRLDQLTHEWGKAEAHVVGEKSAHRTDTREHSQAPPASGPHAEYAFLREWWTAMRLAERARYGGERDGLTKRMVLRALAAAAQRNGSRYVSVGVRGLGLGCNLGRTAVAAALRELRDEDDPLIDLIENERGGLLADIYQLRIPAAYEQQSRTAPWRPGKLEAIHHAFLELGVPAAFVYEALGESRDPLRTVDVAAAAMLSRRAAGQALLLLAEHGMAERGPGGWRRGPVDVDQVAERLDTTQEKFQSRVELYRRERATWRQWLSEHATDGQTDAEPPVDRWSIELREPMDDEPPDVDQPDWDPERQPPGALTPEERGIAIALNATVLTGVGP
jgi:hypothetical protein